MVKRIIVCSCLALAAIALYSEALFFWGADWNQGETDRFNASMLEAANGDTRIAQHSDGTYEIQMYVTAPHWECLCEDRLSLDDARSIRKVAMAPHSYEDKTVPGSLMRTRQ